MATKPNIVNASNFQMATNDQATDAQANETFRLTANKGKALGSDMQTQAFAKVGLSNYLYEFQEKFKGAEGDPLRTHELKAQEAKIQGMLYAASDMMENRSEAEKIKSATPEGFYDDRGLLTRAVASSEVAKLFNSKTVSEERFGIDDQGRTIGISVQADGAAVQSEYAIDGPGSEKVDCYLDIDYSDPQIQQGLYELEAMDYVTGQYDRHGGNLYVDPATKQVTGIDNDLAFPEVSREELLKRRGPNNKAAEGMPDYLHQETAAKIMSVTPDQLEKTLRDLPRPPNASPLSESAIQGAKDRLTALQGAIGDSQQAVKEGRQPAIQVVDQFTPQTYAAAIQKQEDHLNTYNQAKGFDKLDQWKASTRLGEITSAGVTSYVGTTHTQALQQKLSEFKAGLDPTKDVAVVRSRGAETALPASRDASMVAKQVKGLEKEIGSLQKKAAEYEKRIESPSLKDRFQSILPGKSRDGIAQDLAAKQEQLLNRSSTLSEERAAIIKREDRFKAPQSAPLTQSSSAVALNSSQSISPPSVPPPSNSLPPIGPSVSSSGPSSVSHSSVPLPSTPVPTVNPGVGVGDSSSSAVAQEPKLSTMKVSDKIASLQSQLAQPTAVEKPSMDTSKFVLPGNTKEKLEQLTSAGKKPKKELDDSAASGLDEVASDKESVQQKTGIAKIGPAAPSTGVSDTTSIKTKGVG